MAEKEPEMVLIDLDSAAQWPETGVSIDTFSIIKELGLEKRLDESGLKLGTMEDGTLLGVPVEGYYWPVWYNKKILDLVGLDIPRTSDELLQMASRVRVAGYQPLSICGACWQGECTFRYIMNSFLSDEELLDFGENGIQDNEKIKQAIEYFVQLRDGGVFADDAAGIDYGMMNSLFYRGITAMNSTGAWAFAEEKDISDQDIVLGGLPVPSGSKRTKPLVGKGYAKFLVVTRNGQKKIEAVKEFIKFWYTPEQMARFEEEAGMTSPLKTSVADPEKLHPLFAQTLDFGDNYEYTPYTLYALYPREINSELVTIMQQAYLSEIKAEEIISDIDAVFATLE